MISKVVLPEDSVFIKPFYMTPRKCISLICNIWFVIFDISYMESWKYHQHILIGIILSIEYFRTHLTVPHFAVFLLKAIKCVGAPVFKRSKSLMCDHFSSHPMGSSPSHVGRSSIGFYPYMWIFQYSYNRGLPPPVKAGSRNTTLKLSVRLKTQNPNKKWMRIYAVNQWISE